MKVKDTTKKPEPEFNPVSVELTFESQDSIDAFYALAGCLAQGAGDDNYHALYHTLGNHVSKHEQSISEWWKIEGPLQDPSIRRLK